MKLAWSPSYSIGHKSIDEDHQRLFQLVNDFVATQDLVTARKTIMQLHDYAKAHFAREEAVLAACGAANLESHRREHEKLATAINSLLLSHLVENKAATERDIIQRVAALLEKWVFHHVLVEDMKQKPAIRQLAERISASQRQARA